MIAPDPSSLPLTTSIRPVTPGGSTTPAAFFPGVRGSVLVSYESHRRWCPSLFSAAWPTAHHHCWSLALGCYHPLWGSGCRLSVVYMMIRGMTVDNLSPWCCYNHSAASSSAPTPSASVAFPRGRPMVVPVTVASRCPSATGPLTAVTWHLDFW